MGNAVLPEIKTLTIDDFCTHMMSEYGNYDKVDVHHLSHEFIKFFDLQYPLQIESISNICRDSSFKLELLSDEHRARGYNFLYGDEVHIFIKANDSPSGQIHTLLHELYEIIDGKLSSYDAVECRRKKNVIEAKADQFSAYVYVPHETVLQWINKHGLDVFGLKEFLTCSYVTALIRLNEVLCELVDVKPGLPTSCIGILYERPYWKGTPSGRTPRLQFTFHAKSRGFSFRLSRNEVKDLKFYAKNIKGLTISRLIKAFSDSNYNLLLKNMSLVFKEQSHDVDILIRTVNWRNYKYTAKILIQIILSDQHDLRDLAERLNITQHEMGNNYESRIVRKSIVGKTG